MIRIDFQNMRIKIRKVKIQLQNIQFQTSSQGKGRNSSE